MHSSELHALTLKDAALGRMTTPVPACEVDLSKVRLVPRFAIHQGTRKDGTPKIRPVDHMSWSHAPVKGRKRTRAMMKETSINGHYEMPGAVKHDHLDDLLATMRMHVDLMAEVHGTVSHLVCTCLPLCCTSGSRSGRRRH